MLTRRRRPHQPVPLEELGCLARRRRPVSVVALNPSGERPTPLGHGRAVGLTVLEDGTRHLRLETPEGPTIAIVRQGETEVFAS